MNGRVEMGWSFFDGDEGVFEDVCIAVPILSGRLHDIDPELVEGIGI